MDEDSQIRELMLLREKIAQKLKIELYATYSEKHIATGKDGKAAILDYHYRTLGRLRREGAFDEIRSARQAVREDTTYFGYEVVDIELGRHLKHRIPRRKRPTGAA